MMFDTHGRFMPVESVAFQVHARHEVRVRFLPKGERLEDGPMSAQEDCLIVWMGIAGGESCAVIPVRVIEAVIRSRT